MTITPTTPSSQVDDELAARLSKLNAERDKKEAKINELYNALVSGTENFENLELSVSEKYDTLITYEYLLTRVRILLSDELRRIDFALSNESILKGQEKAFYTKRKTYLMSVNTHLTEIREDLNVLQKTTYFMKDRF